jgi:tRNA-dihydrouridine synthase
VILHARTRKEMSSVPARWEEVARAVKIRDALGSGSYIVGNGDALDLADASLKAQESGVDGVMLGRAIFGNPWLFSGLGDVKSGREISARPPTLADRLRVLIEHARLFEELLGDVKSFAIMKKHFKAYINGFSGAQELRLRLMDTKTGSEVMAVLEAYLSQKDGI